MSQRLQGASAEIQPSSGAFDAVAISASAGGPEALSELLGRLPENFPSPIFVVQHLHRYHDSAFVDILARRSSLRVKWADHGELPRAGMVYVARRDCHLVIRPSLHLALTRTEPVKFARPAADLLFVSLAAAYRARAIGVVLTGCNSDGSLGTQAIKWAGGRVLAQDPRTARGSEMPASAIATGCVDFVLPLETLGAALIALTMAPGAADFLRVPLAAA